MFRWQKRMSNGYSVDINYTWSRLNDNQWGESNSFSNRQGSAMNNYNIDEYGVSLLDVAHRVNFSATFQLPFGEGRKWVNNGGIGEALLGGWQVTTTGGHSSPAVVHDEFADRISFRNAHCGWRLHPVYRDKACLQLAQAVLCGDTVSQHG